MSKRVTAAGGLLSLASGVVLTALAIWVAVVVAREPATNGAYVPPFISAIAVLLLFLPFAACYLVCGVFLLKSGPTGKAPSRIGVTVATAILLIPSLASLLTAPSLAHLALVLPVSATLLLWYPAKSSQVAGSSESRQ